MTAFLSPGHISWQQAIVDQDGRPSPDFLRFLQQITGNAGTTQGTATAAATTADAAVPQTRKINTTSPITGGGDLSADRTLAHATSGVTAATYGDATHVAQVTVDANGHVTLGANVAITTGSTTNPLTINNSGSGAASGSTFNGSAAITISYNSIGAAGTAAANTFSAKQTLSGGADITPAATPTTTAVGYLGAPQNTQNANYTTVMADSGKHIYHTSASAHTWTIDSNANVAYPIGTILTFINENAGGVVTLAIASDTLRWGSSTGSRSLAANATATAVKVASTTWRLTGDGIT